jgi:hypothetical protein
MAQEILGTAWLLLPLLGGALFHGLCMKYGWLGFLARPIDAGRRLGGQPLFGRSKTFRGPVAVALGAGAVFALQRSVLHEVDAVAGVELVDYARLPGWMGALAGTVGELAELPNSFAKRRLGIEPSATAQGRPLRVLFYLADQLDVLAGYGLVVFAFVPPTPLRIASALALGASLHPLITLTGYLLGMRPSAR